MTARSRLFRAAALTGGALTLAAGAATVAPTAASASIAGPALAYRNVPVCPAPPQHYAHCHAILHQAVTANGKPAPNASSPTGYSPSTYDAAYGWSIVSGSGKGKTIAIVDAYNDPTIVNDLATFDQQFNLPTASLQVVNQSGGALLPKNNSGWALEISLDVEWAHATAPAANIVLVEASSSSMSNLLAAEDYAGTVAQYVTNSWGGSESSSESGYDKNFSEPGVSYFASSGDSGGVVEYPSASRNVISVGGTTLTDSGTWAESAWSSGGGGCSAYETANGSQVTSPNVTCGGMRATPDVASDADPNTGVAVYDSTSYYGQTGWFEVGGTSAASPVWAARSADAGTQVNAAYVYAGYPGSGDTYGTNITFRDVTTGSNGYPAGVGFDLATGLGSWTGGTTSSSGSSTGGGGTSSGPSAPTLSGTVLGSTMSLSWTAVSGAAYTVYRNGSSIATTSAISYSDTVKAAGSYSYDVTATVNGSTSNASDTVSMNCTKTRGQVSCS